MIISKNIFKMSIFFDLDLEYELDREFKDMCRYFFNNIPDDISYLEKIINYSDNLLVLSNQIRENRKNAIIRYMLKKNRKKNTIKQINIKKSKIATEKKRGDCGRFEKKSIV